MFSIRAETESPLAAAAASRLGSSRAGASRRRSGPVVALIYKILSAEQWRAFEADGQFAGAPVDRADGYIHFSTREQVAGTAAKHFAGQSGLVLAAVETEGLDALRWEPSRGGALFPHLYAALPLTKVLRARPLPLGADGRHDFTGLLA